jgi:predicted house-cleaning noncanonical NTP pyrophosphatase (MazG superfamily)
MTERTEYDKLVRDRIPEIIVADGATPLWTVEAYGPAQKELLKEKLEEEVEEYIENDENEEGLADILEVLHALCKKHEMSMEDLEEIRKHKAKERGRFDNFVILEAVEE